MSLPPDLPLAEFAPTIAGRRWAIAAVGDQDALLDAAAAFTEVPYGLLLWESSVSLARELAQRADQIRGRSVLELGCGVGLAGCVAAHLGARVLQTDHEPAALALAAANVRANGLADAGVRQLLADWRRWPVRERFDYVIGADVLYEPAMHGAVIAVAEASLRPGGRALLTDPGRPETLPLLGALERAGWRIALEIETVEDLLVAGRRVDVSVVEAVPPPGATSPG